jgi:predicted transcriptional regulator
MPAERLPMRQIRELLRLRFSSGLSQRAIGHSLGLSQAAVSEYLSRARCAGVTWPLPEILDDAQLEARCQTTFGIDPLATRRIDPLAGF